MQSKNASILSSQCYSFNMNIRQNNLILNLDVPSVEPPQHYRLYLNNQNMPLYLAPHFATVSDLHKFLLNNTQ